LSFCKTSACGEKKRRVSIYQPLFKLFSKFRVRGLTLANLDRKIFSFQVFFLKGLIYVNPDEKKFPVFEKKVR